MSQRRRLFKERRRGSGGRSLPSSFPAFCVIRRARLLFAFWNIPEKPPCSVQRERCHLASRSPPRIQRGCHEDLLPLLLYKGDAESPLIPSCGTLANRFASLSSIICRMGTIIGRLRVVERILQTVSKAFCTASGT